MTRLVRALAVVALACAARTARAEKPWSVRASAGAGIAKSTGEVSGTSYGFNGTFSLDAVFGPTPSVASIGVHAALSPSVEVVGYDTESMFDRTWHVKLLPLHVGVVGHLGLRGQFWLEPWVGAHYGFHLSECETFYDKRTAPPTTTVTCTKDNNSYYSPTVMFAIGLQAGRVVWRQGAQSVSLFAALARAFGDDDNFSNLYGAGFQGMWLGASYSF